MASAARDRDTTDRASSRPSPRSGLETVFVSVVLGAAALFYFFTVKTSGDLRVDGVPADYYNLLVDGFRAGHLYLPVEPDAKLRALADPYDPGLNHDVRLADASYYGGHYYIYFGITPAAVLMLPYTLITGKHMPQAAAVLIFCLTGVGAACTVWLGVRRRHFPESRWWMAPLGVGVIAFGGHVLALARRPMIWELPIAAGFAFVMLAVLAAYTSMRVRRPALAFGFAALCLGLAVGARPTAVLAAAILVVPVCHLRRTRDGHTWLRAAVAGAVVFGAIGIGLAWYNYARFGSAFEFGQKYQLTSLREGAVPHYSWRFVPYNLRAYFAWPVQWTSDFPFIASRPLPPMPPGYFSGEEMYWLAVLSPFLWFAPVGMVFWRMRQVDGAAGFGAVVMMITAVFLPLWIFMMFFFYAAERYMADFVPMLMLLAACGSLVVERAAQRHFWRRLTALAIAAAGAVTITTGLLASFDYHGRSMRQAAPDAWKRISGRLDPIVRQIVGH